MMFTDFRGINHTVHEVPVMDMWIKREMASVDVMGGNDFWENKTGCV